MLDNINENNLQRQKVGAEPLTKYKYVNKLHTFTNLIITLNTLIMSNKGDKVTYNHDKVYEVNKERFESMNCFKKYKSYTNTNNIPTFCRDLS